jgi:hypothetical protein
MRYVGAGIGKRNGHHEQRHNKHKGRVLDLYLSLGSV